MKKLYSIIILSVLSIANAIYLTINAFRYKTGKELNSLCDINDTLSCSGLFGFDFAWIFGIPFPAIAMGVYPIIIIIALLGILKKCKKTFQILFTLGLGGILFNGYIIYNEFHVGVFCPACLACTGAITIITILSLIGFRYKK